ncbi:MAG TPA: pyridoxal-phosphate dependent enzyme [Gaiellaceae bacterium]
MIALEEITAARARIAGPVLRTPLVQLQVPEARAEIYLKLENLQPIGSFKLRGALNAILQIPEAELADGVVTASAGNMGQGVAWAARELGVRSTVVVPDGAAETKVAAIERLGGEVVKVPYEQWWDAIATSSTSAAPGRFVHPVEDEAVMAGNGTIGLEILEDLPDADAILVPYGGGGLSVGIASAIRALDPTVPVYAVEPEPAAALTASLAAGEPCEVEGTPSFVDGSGSPRVLPKMWPLAREVLNGAFAVPVDDAADAVRLLVNRARIVAEGAGALATAAALAGRAGSGKVVAIVSGGNIDEAKLGTILSGGTP